MTFIYIIAVWAIPSGVVLLAAAVRPRRAHGEGLLLVAGLLSPPGDHFPFWPMAGVLAIAWWIGAYAILFGAVMVMFALHLRRRRRDMSPA